MGVVIVLYALMVDVCVASGTKSGALNVVGQESHRYSTIGISSPNSQNGRKENRLHNTFKNMETKAYSSDRVRFVV
jgi:hypothetical protein